MPPITPPNKTPADPPPGKPVNTPGGKKLRDLSRKDLEQHGKSRGIASPGLYGNIDALATAIEELTTTGRPDHIEQDIAATVAAQESIVPVDEPAHPKETPKPDPFVLVPRMRVSVFDGEQERPGHLVQQMGNGLWQVATDDGASILTRQENITKL